MQALENGEYTNTDYYIAHMEISSNPLCVLLITDMLVQLWQCEHVNVYMCTQESTGCTEIKDTWNVRMEHQLGDSTQQSEGHTA